MKAVILAAGRGTRMQKELVGVPLTPEQRAMADEGLKGLIPIHGKPFLSYVMSALADAGCGDVCLVVAPDADEMRRAFEEMEPRRVRVSFAVQEEPLGSAHALLSAERFAAGDRFLLINSDNYYTPAPMARLIQLRENGLVGYDREALVRKSNIPPDRIAAYALVTADADGYLERIVEKPTPEQRRELEGRSWISMTCWWFGPSIFEACRSISPSGRGELELPDAVAYANHELRDRFRIIPSEEPVLDLSKREDIPTVEEHLRGMEAAL